MRIFRGSFIRLSKLRVPTNVRNARRTFAWSIEGLKRYPAFVSHSMNTGAPPSGEVGVKCTKFTDAITNRPKNSITYSKLSNDDERIAGTRRKLKELEET